MTFATVLALAAAVLHAGWNLTVKTSGNRFLALWGQWIAAGTLCAAGLVVTGLPERESVPFAALSGALHLPYVVALSKAYDAGDFSLAYPLARGGGALLAAIGGLVLLDDRLSALGWVAAVIVAVALMTFVRRDTPWLEIEWALVVAAIIGAYTITDAAGARRSTGVAYVLLGFVFAMLTVSAYGLARGRWTALRAASAQRWPVNVGAGAATVAAYGLVLIAVRHAPVGYVTALRESSVVLAALAGWRLLGEGLGRARLVSSGVVVAGLVLLVTSS